MTSIQSIIGYLMMISGVIYGLASGNYEVVFIGIFAGLVLTSLAKVVEHLQDIHYRILGVPLTDRQLSIIEGGSHEALVLSDTLEIFPKDASFPILRLDDNDYIRARIFKNYLSEEDKKYTFHFPNRDPQVYTCALNYYPGIDMCVLNGFVHVKLSALSEIGLSIRMNVDDLVIENPKIK